MKEVIITSSALILCIMVIRHFLKGKISSRLQYALWLLVAVRLLIPVPAQISLSLGALDEFRFMDVAGKLEEKFGSITENLEAPIGFAVNLDSFVGKQIAESILKREMPDSNTADGPTSVFLAGRIGVTWIEVLRGIWLGGMGIMAVWMIVVNLRFRHRLYKMRQILPIPKKVADSLNKKVSGVLQVCCPETEEGLQKENEGYRREEEKKRYGWRRQVKVYTAQNLTSPFLYGLPGRAAIYLPEGIMEEENRLRHVLTHEICHKRHGDSIWSLLRCVLLVLYWFHPLVWAAAILSRRDCELACDESALLLLGEQERIDYGKTLLSIITGKGKLSDFACTATTMNGSGGSIKERIRYIARKPKTLGVAAAAALILLTMVSVLTFTKSPQFTGGTWEGGMIYVMTGDKQIMLPETIAGISGYANIDGARNDLIIYQSASDQEVGRFCTVTYEEALHLVDTGRSVVPLGDYGQNSMLKQYMGLSEAYDVSGESAKAPFEFDGKTEWQDDKLEQSSKNPFAFDGQSEWPQNEQSEYVTEDGGSGVPGTDSNSDETTYMIPDEDTGAGMDAKDSVVFLPDEQVVQVETAQDLYLRDCYLYVTADYAGVKEKYLDEMHYIDSELKAVAGKVIVMEMNRDITEETYEKLARHKTSYLGDNSEVSALVTVLPEPRKLSYQGMALKTEPEEMSLQLTYRRDTENWSHIDQDVMFFDAAMLFATIENLEECVFRIEDEDGALVQDISYDRAEVTRLVGVESLWSELEGEELRFWLKELHHHVISYLSGKPE